VPLNGRWSGEPREGFGAARSGSHPDLNVAGLIVGGGTYFLRMLIFGPGVLETEPADADLFAARSGVTE
jgi:hypothetical protein